jgi:endogenous inhibitor of DNA gyrase (YacG/DUF329 family)
VKETPAKKEIIISCPKCQGDCLYSPSNPFRPFCSSRCQNDDIIQWTEEGYRLPDRPAESEELDAEFVADVLQDHE